MCNTLGVLNSPHPVFFSKEVDKTKIEFCQFSLIHVTNAICRARQDFVEHRIILGLFSTNWIQLRVASSDSNFYSLLEISISKVASVVGSLLFVSQYQMGNLYFYLITTYNPYFSDENILKNYSSHVLHSDVGEHCDVSSVQKNLNLNFMSNKTSMSFWLLFQLLSGFAHIKSKSGSTEQSGRSKSNINYLFSTSEKQYRTR